MGESVLLPKRGINVTVTISSGLMDVRLRRKHTLLHLRYGVTAAAERKRLVSHARSRAERASLALEQMEARRGREGRQTWSTTERRLLLRASAGGSHKLNGYHTAPVWPIELYPDLADDPNNVRWLRNP